jgi:hypothetical protein
MGIYAHDMGIIYGDYAKKTYCCKIFVKKSPSYFPAIGKLK